MSKKILGVPAGAAPNLSKRDALRQLAKRCEREEASRELDAAMAVAIGWTDVRLEYISSFTQDWHGLAVGETEGVDLVPLWTRSLDAAVTLVPPDCWRETNGPRRSINIPSPVPNFWHCEVTEWSFRRDFHGWASTEPLAICAAALKARAAVADVATEGQGRSEAEHAPPPLIPSPGGVE